jgi:hypothetical protein
MNEPPLLPLHALEGMKEGGGGGGCDGASAVAGLRADSVGFGALRVLSGGIRRRCHSLTYLPRSLVRPPCVRACVRVAIIAGNGFMPFARLNAAF